MPGGDRTGPMSMGPMTGRGMGVCAGYPGSAMYLGGGRFARGCGMGFGGRGYRNRFFATGLPRWARGGRFTTAASMPMAQQELSDLKQQAQYLQNSLIQINSCIEQLEKE